MGSHLTVYACQCLRADARGECPYHRKGATTYLASPNDVFEWFVEFFGMDRREPTGTEKEHARSLESRAREHLGGGS